MPHVREVFLAVAAIPFIYYLISIYSSWRYFQQPPSAPDGSFTPPVSILKPFRGTDPDEYENLARFCRLYCREFEIGCCVDPDDEAIQSVLVQLAAEFPNRRIRGLHGSRV